jgi:hypothetical protein
MPLDQTARGVLEQIIDGIIRNIPDFVKILYNPSQKAQLHIENERDFLLGISRIFISSILELLCSYIRKSSY